MSDSAPEIIGREILRLDNEADPTKRPLGTPIGQTRRKAIAVRRKALVWSLHVVLTGDRTGTPGAEVETFLGALKAREGGTQ